MVKPKTITEKVVKTTDTTKIVQSTPEEAEKKLQPDGL